MDKPEFVAMDVSNLSEDEIYELMREDWNNNSCLGYAIRAAEDLKMDFDTIQKLVRAVKNQFDILTIEQAAKVYWESPY